MEPCNYQNELLCNVHKELTLPGSSSDCEVVTVTGSYNYYHYGCDGFDDRGWGCGYRTLQTLASWIKNEYEGQKEVAPVPSIIEIQQILVNAGDKPCSFLSSKEWIGSFEVFVVLDSLYGVSSRILHTSSRLELVKNMATIKEHFRSCGTPVMMGGDRDASSKGIMGVCSVAGEHYLLIVDPHFFGRPRGWKELQEKSWVKWQPVTQLLDSSFYNMCFPQWKTEHLMQDMNKF